ncbi:NTHL1 [Cordylochernes scorpioides]|uniref:NTHL1 n=1 Tax=Cordylochernes scorpioides TaxID=51811 RepID=A0ABY6L5N7_9ARAC|nr:NTHL1 [Cordylochernes scorpioides]
MLLRSRKLPTRTPTTNVSTKKTISKKPESDIKEVKTEEIEANASNPVTSIYFQKKDEEKNIPLKKRRHIAIKVDTANDKWEPPGWKETLENIRRMRSLKNAPVDTLGAHCCADRSADPKYIVGKPCNHYEISLFIFFFLISTQLYQGIKLVKLVDGVCWG